MPETPKIPVGPELDTEIKRVPAPAEARPLARPVSRPPALFVKPPTKPVEKPAPPAPAEQPAVAKPDTEDGKFIATEYIFQGPSGNHLRVVKRFGEPIPTPPPDHRLISPHDRAGERVLGVNLHPFDTAAERDAALI